MRLHEVRARLADYGLRISPTGFGAEYRVAFMALSGKAQEASAYYSDCLEDCLLTGIAMHRQATSCVKQSKR